MLALILHAIIACTTILLKPGSLSRRVQAGISQVAQARAHTREVALHVYAIENAPPGSVLDENPIAHLGSGELTVQLHQEAEQSQWSREDADPDRRDGGGDSSEASAFLRTGMP